MTGCCFKSPAFGKLQTVGCTALNENFDLMTKDEKIDRLLNSYGQVFSGAIGEVYTIAFGEAPTDIDDLHKRMRDIDNLRDSMLSRGLLTSQPGEFPGVFFKISELGQEIVDNGGWLNQVTRQSKNSCEAQTRDRLEFENLQLQNSSLKAELEKKGQKEEMDKLTIENLKLQNRNSGFGFLIIGGLIGFVLGNLKWILELFGLMKSGE